MENKLLNDMKASLKSGDKVRLSVIRMSRAAIKNKEIELKEKLSDDDIIEVLSSLVKRYQESIEQYKTGGRDELVHKEEAELVILQEYLPEPLDDDELKQIVDEVVSEAEATGKNDLGKVMKLIMPRVRGRADGRMVKETVLSKLTN